MYLMQLSKYRVVDLFKFLSFNLFHHATKSFKGQVGSEKKISLNSVQRMISAVSFSTHCTRIYDSRPILMKIGKNHQNTR